MSTYPEPEPLRLLGYSRRRPAIEERHRQLKCFYDLSDFRSRSFNAIAAQVVMVLLTYTKRGLARRARPSSCPTIYQLKG